jgi:hypothetical protein
MWNKTSIILMLIWHGSGFAFRYTRLPHLEDQNISDNGTGTIEEIIFTHFAVGQFDYKYLYWTKINQLIFHFLNYRTTSNDCITK